MSLISVLQNFGLNNRQANLYLNCLELGAASAYKIAKKINIPRSSCYEDLEDLCRFGLVYTYNKKKVKYFAPEDPRKFINLRENQLLSFRDSLPQFDALYTKKRNKPQLRLYEGLENMKTVFGETVSDNPREILCISDTEDILAELPDFWKNYLSERVKKKIPVRIIYRDTPEAHERKMAGQKYLRQAKILPSDIVFSSVIMLWNNKIALFSFREDHTALIIESKEFNDTFKVLFELIWGII